LADRRLFTMANTLGLLEALAQGVIARQGAIRQNRQVGFENQLQFDQNARANEDQDLQRQDFETRQKEANIRLQMLNRAFQEQQDPDHAPYSEQDMVSDATAYAKMFNVEPRYVLDALRQAAPKTHGDAKGVYYQLTSRGTGKYSPDVPGSPIPNPTYTPSAAPVAVPPGFPSSPAQPNPLDVDLGSPLPDVLRAAFAPKPAVNAPAGPDLASSPMILGPATRGAEIKEDVPLWQTWPQMPTEDQSKINVATALAGVKDRSAAVALKQKLTASIPSFLAQMTRDQFNTSALPSLNAQIATLGGGADEMLDPLPSETLAAVKVGETSRHNQAAEKNTADRTKAMIDFNGKRLTIQGFNSETQRKNTYIRGQFLKLANSRELRMAKAGTAGKGQLATLKAQFATADKMRVGVESRICTIDARRKAIEEAGLNTPTRLDPVSRNQVPNPDYEEYQALGESKMAAAKEYNSYLPARNELYRQIMAIENGGGATPPPSGAGSEDKATDDKVRGLIATKGVTDGDIINALVKDGWSRGKAAIKVRWLRKAK
jgi:hypothetical protein